MSIIFTCPHCGKTTNVADQYAGQSGPCSGCGQTVTIPAASSAQTGAPAAPRGQATPVLGVVLAVVLVVVLGCGGVLAALLIPAVQSARTAARRAQSSNNLKQIGLAMHNYHDVYKAFPLAGSEDPDLGIGLSWRVRLLPFLEQAPLYDMVDFNEPWDSPANSALIHQMPPSYQSPSAPPSSSQTVYLAVIADGDANSGPGNPPAPRPLFDRSGKPPRMADVVDGTSNTVMAVEADADQAATWTQPQDLPFDPQNPRRGLGNLRGEGFMVLMADGSVRMVTKDIDNEVVRRMMLRNDGLPVMLPNPR